MPAFHFVAVNNKGQEQKGVIEAETEKQARQLLRQRTLIPLNIRATQQKKTDIKGVTFSFLKRERGLTAKDLALITRQFATLLAAGLPIEQALQAVAEQTQKAHMKGLILSVRSKVMEGHTLSGALQEHPEAFSSLYCATIAAGEKTGHLDKVLLRLADYTEQQWHLRQKLQSALIYPSMIIFVAFGIVGFLMEYVVPKMVSVYGHLKQGLPGMTEVLIVLSEGIKAYGLYVLLLMVIAVIGWRRALKKHPALRERSHHILLRLPLVGYAANTSNTARFARTLSILSASGVPALEAMGIASQLITTIPIRKAVEEAVHRVREGMAIHLALKEAQFFSPMTIHMVASGEASGQLEAMLERVAQQQEDEIVRLIDVALALFEPAIILIMGAVVLFIVLAVLLPIFQINQFTG